MAGRLLMIGSSWLIGLDGPVPFGRGSGRSEGPREELGMPGVKPWRFLVPWRGARSLIFSNPPRDATALAQQLNGHTSEPIVRFMVQSIIGLCGRGSHLQAAQRRQSIRAWCGPTPGVMTVGRKHAKHGGPGSPGGSRGGSRGGAARTRAATGGGPCGAGWDRAVAWG